MPVLRSTALIDAAPATVAGLLRDVELTARALRRDGHRVAADVRLLAPGDQVRIGLALLPGVRLPVRMVLDAVSETEVVARASGGVLPELVRSVRLTPTPAGTLVLDELRWTAPGGPLGRLVDVLLGRRLVLRAQAATLCGLADRAAALAGGPVVVAAAVHRSGRLLVARRARPAALAGRWELPGGRVEPGESELEALGRECREELAAAVTVTGRLGTDLPIDAGVLRVYAAELAGGAAEPQPLEHDALRWVGPAELAGLDWLDADRAVLADLAGLLRR
ncbi:MAG TPA: NUDIX domain-containing protein [Pseudonocardia sp.]|nr:NUDIX domain-containing protein [Pseudonocardia sp.]